MLGFFFGLLATAAGLWIAAAIVPGIDVGESSTFFLAAIVLGFVNAFVRPIIILLTLPLSVMTMGLFLLVINAGMLGLVAWLMDDFNLSGFFAALLGSFVISIVNWWTSRLIGPQGDVELITFRKSR